MAFTADEIAFIGIVATVVSAWIALIWHLIARPQELQFELQADAVRNTYKGLAAIATDARDLWNKVHELESVHKRKPPEQAEMAMEQAKFIMGLLQPKLDRVAEDWAGLKKTLIELGYQFPNHRFAPAFDRLEDHATKIVSMARLDALPIVV